MRVIYIVILFIFSWGLFSWGLAVFANEKPVFKGQDIGIDEDNIGFGASALCHLNAVVLRDTAVLNGVALFEPGATLWFANTTAQDDSIRLVTKYHCIGGVSGQIIDIRVTLGWRSEDILNLPEPPQKKTVRMTVRIDQISDGNGADRVVMTMLKIEAPVPMNIPITLLGWNKNEDIINEREIYSVIGYPRADLQKVAFSKMLFGLRNNRTVSTKVIEEGGYVESGNSGGPLLYKDMVIGDIRGVSINFFPPYVPCEEEAVYPMTNWIGAEWNKFGAWFDNAGTGVDSIGSKEMILQVDYDTQTNPVELASFTAQLKDQNQIFLQWITKSETNNFGFEVTRRIGEDSDWSKIGFVEGQGTTVQSQVYQFVDKIKISGKYYYRLKQIDSDGTYKYYGPVLVEVLAKQFALQQNYPNPFNPATTITYNLSSPANVNLTVYNAAGQEVAELINIFQTAGQYEVVWNAENQPSGIYFYKLTAGQYTEMRKMILVK